MAQSQVSTSERERALEAKFEELYRLYMEIYREYFMYQGRIPWDWKKVLDLYPRFKSLAEELLREYTSIGSPRANGVRFMMDVIERVYETAVRAANP